jgi:hypothetical protein
MSLGGLTARASQPQLRLQLDVKAVMRTDRELCNRRRRRGEVSANAPMPARTEP